MLIRLERLRQLRQNSGATQGELAALMGVKLRQYQRYEYGEQEPGLDGWILLADHFNVSLDYLVGRSDVVQRR